MELSYTSGPVMRPGLTRALLRASGKRQGEETISLDELIGNLGEHSFGWCLLLFAMVNLTPLPIGSNVITAIPLILLTAQMTFGCRHVRLPGIVTKRRVPRSAFRRLVLRARPAIRLLERMARPRHAAIFSTNYYRIISGLLLAFSIALFLPIPLSGFIPAASLFLAAVGIIAGDGLAMLMSLVLGMVSIAITIGVAGAIVAAAHLIA
jgi:hypothetical protein